MLNDDLALDYDSAGLAVSATFVIMLANFLVLVAQTADAGFAALLEPPGSYCAYACLYFTLCLVKVFTFATLTFEEQHRHVSGLQVRLYYYTEAFSESSISIMNIALFLVSSDPYRCFIPSASVRGSATTGKRLMHEPCLHRGRRSRDRAGNNPRRIIAFKRGHGWHC